MCKTGSQPGKIDDSTQLISLMNVYLEERNTRDTLMWKQMFSFFLAALVVIVFPYVQIWEHSRLAAIPDCAYFWAGLVLSGIFFFLSMAACARMTCINNTYKKLIDKLEEDYRRDKIEDLDDYIFTELYMKEFSRTVYTIMTALLVILDLILYCFC